MVILYMIKHSVIIQLTKYLIRDVYISQYPLSTVIWLLISTNAIVIVSHSLRKKSRYYPYTTIHTGQWRHSDVIMASRVWCRWTDFHAAWEGGGLTAHWSVTRNETLDMVLGVVGGLAWTSLTFILGLKCLGDVSMVFCPRTTEWFGLYEPDIVWRLHRNYNLLCL